MTKMKVLLFIIVQFLQLTFWREILVPSQLSMHWVIQISNNCYEYDYYSTELCKTMSVPGISEGNNDENFKLKYMTKIKILFFSSICGTDILERNIGFISDSNALNY